MAPPIPRGRVLAGAAALVGCGQYFAAEAIAAAAWEAPRYSYLKNYISDLGVTVGTGVHHSPLAWVMNTGLFLSGLLCAAAATLLIGLLPGRAARVTVLTLAALQAAGSLMLSFVHSAPGTSAGTPRLHLVAAYLAIVGGNLAILVVGLSLRGARGPALHAAFSLACGLLGLGAGLALVLGRWTMPGLLERMAVDTIPAWQVVTGIGLLVGRRSLLPILSPRRP